MSYLKEFKEKIERMDYPGFLKIWEEYCFSDSVDNNELTQILIETKNSVLAKQFGQHVNRALSLWEKMEDNQEKHEILKLIIDIQTKNDEELAEVIYLYLKERNTDDKLFNEKIRLIGLRSKNSFQGAISKYELLSHIGKGKFVFHTAGWGTGEILEFSMIREEITLEFEYVIEQKNLSFDNAFNTLTPLKDDHFLSLRFGNPDLLEQRAKKNPAEILHLLLRDLGPKNAAEIKDNICDLVIPAKEWNKWWQSAKTKLKKDTKIDFPKKTSQQFALRTKEISHEESLYKEFESKPNADEIIKMVHSFLRDFPETVKNQDFRNSLITKLTDVLSFEDLDLSKRLQVHFFLEQLTKEKDYLPIKAILEECPSLKNLIKEIDIIAFKKKAFMAIRKYKENWQDTFLDLFFSVEQNVLRDYLFNELLKIKSNVLKDKLKDLLIHPLIYPQCFVWYFQKLLIKPKKKIPLNDSDGIIQFFEGFMILLDHLESKPQYRDLTKKMIHLITAGRYELIRDIFKKASLAEVKEFLLLSTKCRLLDDHDIKIIHSLAKVVHPSIKSSKHIEEKEEEIIWATAQGYEDLKKKIENLATKEMIKNAKEIEEARAHGDLRENAEYKAALEKRARLQGELKFLSDQFNKARIITKELVKTDKTRVGTVVECTNNQNKTQSFTILGPLEANPDKNILSFQSKFAQAILDKTIGEKFTFQKDEFTITKISNYFS